MEEWKEVRLGDVTSILGDGIHGTPKYSEKGGYYFINGSNLCEGEIIIKPDTKRVSEEEYQKYKKDLNDRTLLFSINGTVGNVAKYNGEPCILGKSACYFNVLDTVDKNYIYYIVSSPSFIKSMSNLANGTTIKNVSLKQMRDKRFLLPPIDEQHSIASILSALDDKIAVNRRICENLEAQAQALFKHWFIDFAPFLDKPSGKAERKDGKFVESELGMIPEGWRVGKLGDYCKVKSGFAFKSSMWTEKGCPVIKIKNITNSGRIDMTDCSYISKQNVAKAKAFKANRGDLVIAMTGATIGKFSILPQFDDETYINQRVGKFFLGNNPLEKLPYVFCLLSDNRNRKQLTTMGQGSAQPNISGSDIESIIAVYSNNVIESFNEICYPMFDMILTKQEENLRLSTLRDALLPKLMSGQIKV